MQKQNISLVANMFSQHCASSVPKVLTDVDSLSLAKWGICTSQLKQNNTVEKCYFSAFYFRISKAT